jgi:hypothetical protein
MKPEFAGKIGRFWVKVVISDAQVMVDDDVGIVFGFGLRGRYGGF